CHLVTDEISAAIAQGLRGVSIGILHIFIQHTSAALIVSENADSDVRRDMSMAVDTIVPEELPWLHVDEGPGVSHMKAILVGPPIQIPITNGQLSTWQGL
ncbi:hypothetical protein BOTBODRAFT_71744, partial [Botryobasidium botryosum FD-172 SS1]